MTQERSDRRVRQGSRHLGGDGPRLRSSYGRRRVGLAVVFLVLVVIVGGIYVAGSRLVSSITAGPADYPGPGSGTAIVRVLPGDSLSDIGVALAKKDVVKSSGAFREAAKSNDKARSLQPGYYRLHTKMSAAGALALLLNPASVVRTKVTIPEGSPKDSILALVADKTELSLADLQSAASNPVALGLPAYANGNLEGFLFPATYVVDPGTTATTALAAMVDRFSAAADEVNLVSGASALGRSPYDIVTIASMIEKEAKVASDYPKVARVVYNRLAAKMPLQLDSTINYVLPRRKGHLSTEDLKTASPYNTYLHPGLPPTPIDSPGIAALQAALNPTPGDWIYFVTIDANGQAAFSSSYQQFLKDKAEAHRKGLL